MDEIFLMKIEGFEKGVVKVKGEIKATKIIKKVFPFTQIKSEMLE